VDRFVDRVSKGLVVDRRLAAGAVVHVTRREDRRERRRLSQWPSTCLGVSGMASGCRRALCRRVSDQKLGRLLPELDFPGSVVDRTAATGADRSAGLRPTDGSFALDFGRVGEDRQPVP
jgi:hypothetical protein